MTIETERERERERAHFKEKYSVCLCAEAVRYLSHENVTRGPKTT